MIKLSQPLTIRLISFFIIVGILAAAAPAGLAQSPVTPTEAMQAGNQSYDSGQFDQAIDIYETILANGVRDSALYFNLGNAYFKQGDLGQAVLNYRRAHRLDPRDSDIRTNLIIARSNTLDRLDGSESGGLSNLVQFIEEWLTLREASILALFLWLAVSCFLTAAILSRRLRYYSLWAAGILGFFLVAGLLSMANRYYRDTTTPPAVIVAQEVDVTSGPGPSDQYLVEFNLHAGAEVRITDNRPGWRQIALPGETFQGWVPVDSIELVIPPGS